LRRFRIVLNPAELSSEKEEQYLQAAQEIFAQDPATIIFIYGHTHFPSLRQLGRRAVINTGTWLKRLDPVAPRMGFLPHVYVPFFCLNYFRISQVEGRIAIDYRKIPKDPPQDLSLLQRLLIWGKRRPPEASLPERTWLDL